MKSNYNFSDPSKEPTDEDLDMIMNDMLDVAMKKKEIAEAALLYAIQEKILPNHTSKKNSGM